MMDAITAKLKNFENLPDYDGCWVPNTYSLNKKAFGNNSDKTVVFQNGAVLQGSSWFFNAACTSGNYTKAPNKGVCQVFMLDVNGVSGS